MASPKEQLIELHQDFHGKTLTIEDSELSMIVDILEQLIAKAEQQDGHSHTLS